VKRRADLSTRSLAEPPLRPEYVALMLA
jgi:hypothetical protein